MKEINERRSIRRFLEQEVPADLVEQILYAATQAPSAKNRQPWKFVVVSEAKKRELTRILRLGLKKEREGEGLLPGSRRHISAAEQTVQIMEQAPVLILVLDTQGTSLHQALSFEAKVYERCNLQSVSAAIENMLLEATHLGLGSLWICDIYFAYDGLCQWLAGEGDPVAAVSIGYSAESPDKRPRKSVEQVTGCR